MDGWEAFYQTKITQQYEVGLRCPGCGAPNPTQSHHLFVRRGSMGDHPMLQGDWNIVQVCPDCHMEESREMQIRAALQKIWDYGVNYILAQVELLPFKVDHPLPEFFFEAVELYERGVRPWEGF
jgi:hypothetical protein